MKVLFLSISTAVSNLNNRGIYPDLIRYIANQGHEVYVVCPFERRMNKKTSLTVSQNVHILGVKTLNITKSNPFEKILATLLIERQFDEAIEKYFREIKFDLVLYATPPITFNSLIKKIKRKHNAKTYLMLKDIFPQNAVDLGLMRKSGILHKVFKIKEKRLFEGSDFIGCMSPANVSYLKENYNFFQQDKIIICPNGIEIIDRSVVRKTEILNKYGVPSNKTIFVYGGNLGAPQGIPNLIKALEKNIERKDAFFLICGGGGKAKMVSEFLKKFNPSNVLYLPMLDRDRYDELEACCDVGLIFLDHRFTIPNFPSRVLAYLECKLPLLVATDENTDIGKIAEENDFGVWCLANDVESISSKIDFYVNNKVLRINMGHNGFNYLKNHYQVSHTYDSIFNVLNA